MFEKHDSLFSTLSDIVVYRSSLVLIKWNAAVFIFIQQAMSHDRLRRLQLTLKLSNAIVLLVGSDGKNKRCTTSIHFFIDLLFLWLNFVIGLMTLKHPSSARSKEFFSFFFLFFNHKS